MLQTLLAERFKLELHSDQKMMPAHSLRLAKNGPKLQSSEVGLLTGQRCGPAEPISGQKHVACKHMTMAMLADTLQEMSERKRAIVFLAVIRFTICVLIPVL
jgi:uncharacterized protein (TIGR03435 family)